MFFPEPSAANFGSQQGFNLGSLTANGITLAGITGPNVVTAPNRRNNATAAGLPANFFRANPGKLGGAFTVENNGRTYYDSGVIEVRRRLSHGLLIQGQLYFRQGPDQFPGEQLLCFLPTAHVAKHRS